jgi:hexosaminidase
VLQPRIASGELPWETRPKKRSTLKGLDLFAIFYAVPEGPLTIAQRFNVGDTCPGCRVPKGRLKLPFKLPPSQPVQGLFAVLLLSLLVGCSKPSPPIIPKPVKVQTANDSFKLSLQTQILAPGLSAATGELLAARLRKSTGYPLPIQTRSDAGSKSAADISLEIDSTLSKNPEAYELKVTADGVAIRAADAAGLFYGVQTLLQLLPPEILGAAPATNKNWEVRAVNLQDEPRFKWRGLMLDVSRHFFSKQEVEKLLDSLAFYKINVFHWHLVDDQGWRLEIKKYPKLTEEGAWRKGVDFGLDPKAAEAYGPDGRYGGFYTQDDIHEVVAYAAARHITVVPEIEMPGHSTAALRAYPELSCTGGPFKADLPAGIFNGVYCAGNEQVFAFLEDVLDEVFKLFPGRYIHLGGDEVPTNTWHNCIKCQARREQEGLNSDLELEGYFIRRMAGFVTAHGRIPIGWSEIIKDKLPRQTVVMDWIGGAVQAASTGHDVVRTPMEFCYFDQYQTEDRDHEPRASGGFLSLEKVYSFEPIPADLKGADREHILGTQANVWTEYIPSFRQLEYQTFPRLCALAEVAWSPKAGRDWDNFAARINAHGKKLRELGVNYRGVAKPGNGE